MRVSGATSVSNANVGGTLTVAGAVSLASTLSVGGATNLLSTVTVSGATGFLGTVRVSGAATMASTLDVAGNTSVGGTLFVTGAGTFDGDISVSGNVNIGGNLGIGTNSPAYALDVVGASDTTIRVRATGAGSGDDSLLRMSVGNADASNYIQFGDNSDSDAGYIRYQHANDSLQIGVNATEAMRINSSGNVSLEGQLQLTKSTAAAVETTAINGITSVSLNFGTAQNFFTSVTAAHTLARPTNARVGQVGSIFLHQQGGSGTVSYNACWNFIGGTAPTFSTTDDAVDRLDYIILSVSSDGTAENIQAVMTQAYS